VRRADTNPNTPAAATPYNDKRTAAFISKPPANNRSQMFGTRNSLLRNPATSWWGTLRVKFHSTIRGTTQCLTGPAGSKFVGLRPVRGRKCRDAAFGRNICGGRRNIDGGKPAVPSMANLGAQMLQPFGERSRRPSFQASQPPLPGTISMAHKALS
jgi:hypothetical protein